jgi:hypothetical protein
LIFFFCTWKISAEESLIMKKVISSIFENAEIQSIEILDGELEY